MENKEVMVKYIGRGDPLYCLKGKVYKKIGESHGLWRIIDESGEDYLYAPELFEVVEERND